MSVRIVGWMNAPLAGHRLAAWDCLRAGFHGGVDLCVEIVGGLLAAHRCQRRRVVERIAGLQLGHRRLELRQELVGNLVDDDDALRGHTALAAVENAAVHRPLHRLVEVTVGQRDECVRPAQFHGGFLEVPARPGGHDRAGALAAGQRHAADALVVDQQR